MHDDVINTIVGSSLNTIKDDVRNEFSGLPGYCDTSVDPDCTGEYTRSVEANIINYSLYVVGVIAVVMIIVAGVQMTTSAGDASKVTKAKRTITYSIIGLVVAIFAYAIVNFVITRL